MGYCIGNDQNFKRDNVGIIYQMKVMPDRQRGLIGATLLKAQFDRSAYGCKLYCCWCAQDIATNKFWEAMGFVPLAFRAGSERKSRVHIFWQKRIRAGDTMTQWWFPSQTTGGSIREDRIVLPIPRETHWSDAKPLILPGMALPPAEEPKRLPSSRKPREPKPPVPSPKRPTGLSSSGLRFTPAKPVETAPERPRLERKSKPKQKNNPKLIAAARELRDRWLEQINAQPVLPTAKYEVSRQSLSEEITHTSRMLLPAA